MRSLLVVAAFLLSACGSAPAPPPSPPAVERPAVLSLPALMEEPQEWSGRQITLIAPLVGGGDSQVLGLPVPGNQKSAADTTRLWLTEPLDEPVASQLGEDAVYLKLQGQISPPGAYGRDSQFPYQFTADTATVLRPERTTLVNLAQNPRALNEVLLEVDGALLATSTGAILADNISSGGVPDTGARQVKLRHLPAPQFLDGLAQSGEVRYGRVTVVGWWQDGMLTPFWVEPSSP